VTSLPYALLFGFFLFGGVLEHKLVRRNQLLLVRFFVITVALIFFGLRGHILTDFTNYYQFFINLDASTLAADSLKYAPGFVYSGYLVKEIFDSYQFWIFVTSAVHILILSAIFRRYLGNISLGLLFFLSYRGVLIEFNLMQNFTGILLFLLSISYVHQRRLFPYLIPNLIGVSFHISSLLYLPLYFVLHRNISMRFGFVIISTATLFYFIGMGLLIEGIYWIISNSGLASLENFLYFFIDTSSFKLSFGFIERLLTLILITIYSDRIKSEVLHGNIFYNLGLIYYSFFMLLSPVNVLADRIPVLFIMFYWVIPPALIIIKHRYRTILACVLIPLSLTKLITSTQDQVAQYDNILFGIRSYEERAGEVIEHNKENL
jgi:hypothetical protein